MNTLGKLYCDLRKSKKYTQEEMASIFGVAPTTISTCERTGKLRVDMLVKYAEYFEVSTDYLLGRTTAKSENPKIQAIYKALGLSENAICILYDENARLKSQRAQKKAQKILERQPLQADDKSNHQRYEQYELLNCEAKEIKRQENVRAKFLSALIEDKHFQQLCEAFCAGYNLMWWKDTMQRPEELERINNQLPDELRPEPISIPDAVISQTEVEAKAFYYDCTRYFMEFLSNAASKTEVSTKKQKARK